jgi:hypothetical protein
MLTNLVINLTNLSTSLIIKMKADTEKAAKDLKANEEKERKKKEDETINNNFPVNILIGDKVNRANEYQLILGPEMQVIGVTWIAPDETGKPKVFRTYHNGFIIKDNQPKIVQGMPPKQIVYGYC